MGKLEVDVSTLELKVVARVILEQLRYPGSAISRGSLE